MTIEEVYKELIKIKESIYFYKDAKKSCYKCYTGERLQYHLGVEATHLDKADRILYDLMNKIEEIG